MGLTLGACWHAAGPFCNPNDLRPILSRWVKHSIWSDAAESPRWLVSKGKREKALKALNRLRPKEEVELGLTVAEVEAIDEAIEQTRLQGTGRWIDLFRGTYLRRTMVSPSRRLC